MADINRRKFIQASAGAGLGLGLTAPAKALIMDDALTLLDRTESTAKSKPIGGRFWVWSSIDRKATTESLRAKYRRLKSHGLDGVFIGGGLDDREFDTIKEAGLSIHCWMWTTNRGDQWIRDHHPDWYMVSRSGKSCFDNPPYVDYYRWVSPVIPGVQSYLVERVGEIAMHAAVSGVHLDYVRYPDVILPRGLWDKYHLDQTEELGDYDFCYSAHTRDAFRHLTGRDPMEIKNPANDQEWLHFRYDSVTDLVKQLAKEARSHDKVITAAVFPTPSIARKICRQDWDKWPLDAACPMVYQSFYNQDIPWIGDCIRENIQAASFPIIAGLYMPDFKTPDEFETALRLVHRRGGAGASLFGGVGDGFWEAFQSTAHALWN